MEGGGAGGEGGVTDWGAEDAVRHVSKDRELCKDVEAALFFILLIKASRNQPQKMRGGREGSGKGEREGGRRGVSG